MKTVGSRELKNRLGRYLGMVGKGETIIVTDRGKPVARLSRPSLKLIRAITWMIFFCVWKRKAIFEEPRGPFKRFKPIKVKGKPMSQMIIEDRD